MSGSDNRSLCLGLTTGRCVWVRQQVGVSGSDNRLVCLGLTTGWCVWV